MMETFEKEDSKCDISNSSSLDFRKESTQITIELTQFVQNGNGILTGNPGVGKSYEIRKLVNHLQKEKKVVLFLPIDKLIAESQQELQAELDLPSNLIKYIASEERVSSSKKGIIIIDAYDAARSREKKKLYLSLIRYVTLNLSEKWNILVVARLFDARRSVELLDIFKEGRDKKDLNNSTLKILKISKDIPCRHVIIPELNQEDLIYVLNQHPVLSKHEKEFNPRLKRLLLNPFFISLILHLIENEKNTAKLNSVYSEVQLLDLYWNSRVECNPNGLNYEIILNKITALMIKAHSLFLNLVELRNFDTTGIDFLMSAGILTKEGVNKNKISFSHNILFDYAVSRYGINDSYDGLFKFISEDNSRIVLLRPSILYFLSKVWYCDKVLFKKICLGLYNGKTQKVPLIGEMMAIRVIVDESNTPDDQDYLFHLCDEDNKYRIWIHAIIFSLLESVDKFDDSLGKPNQKFWLDYFEKIIFESSYPSDFNVVAWLYKIQNEDKNPEIQIQIGRISRNILSNCYLLRQHDNNIDRFASHLPVTLVVKTYGTEIYESKKVIEKIFEIAKEDEFELSYLISVGYNIKEIFAYDLDFVSKFYRYIFSTTEESKKQTELGSAGYLRMTSNRRQDFESIRYHLGQESEALLDSNLQNGLEILISSINHGVCRMHIHPTSREGHTIRDRIYLFDFNKQESKFLEDFCYIWGDSLFHMEPESQMLTHVKNKLAKLAEKLDTRSDLNSALQVFGKTSVVAILWRDLIKIASQNPEPFTPILFDLITANPLQIHSETNSELGELIVESLPFLSSDVIKKLVVITIRNFEEEDNAKYSQYLVERRNYLLSKIPSEFFPNAVLRSEIDNYLKENDTPPRKPIEFGEAKFGFVSEERILKFRGIDNSSKENGEILSKIFTVKKFNDKWSNEEISEDDGVSILYSLDELLLLVENPGSRFSQEIVEYSWDELARCGEILARGIKNPASRIFECSRNILLKSATLDVPSEENFTPDYDPLSWSPTPVTNAADGLLHLYSVKNDEEIWESIEVLSRNQNPVVRSIIAINLKSIFYSRPDHYWYLLDSFIENEKNYKIHELICFSLHQVYRINNKCFPEVEKRLEKIMDKSKILEKDGTNILNNNCFIQSVSYLSFVDKHEWAQMFLDDVIQKKALYYSLQPRFVSININGYFTNPQIFNTKFDPTRELISKWLNRIIKSNLDEIRRIVQNPQLIDIDKQVEELYEVIDQYVTRLFFAVDKKYNKIDTLDKQNHAVRLIWNLEKSTISLMLNSILDMDNKFALRGQEMRYLMEMLDSFMPYDPRTVLELASKSLKIGQRIGYSSDHLGKQSILEFIDHFIADHRETLNESSVMGTFTELLDCFAQGNSPEANKLIMKLDLMYQ